MPVGRFSPYGLVLRVVGPSIGAQIGQPQDVWAGLVARDTTWKLRLVSADCGHVQRYTHMRAAAPASVNGDAFKSLA